MNHLFSLLKIELLQSKRQAGTYLLSIGMPTAFYLLFSGLYGNIPEVPTFNRDYLLAMTAFSLMSTAFFSLPAMLDSDKTSNWLKNIAHSPVSMVEYYLAKLLAVLADFLLSILLVFSVGHFVRGVEMSAAGWLISGLLLILGSVTFILLGLLLTLLPTMQLASVVGNILYMGLAVLGGLWMPISMFPDWMQTIGKQLPTYQLMQLLTHFLNQGQLSLSAVAYLLVYSLIAGGLLLVIKKRMEVD